MTRLQQLLVTQFRALHHARAKVHWRALATHRDAFPSLVAQLDPKQNASRGDYVGPFPLGIVPPAQGRDSAPVKAWKQLSPTGKGVFAAGVHPGADADSAPTVLRASARTSNFTVIALGASLTALLVCVSSISATARNS